ncbi:MAG: SDR family NAD(P)-dependent oxidoreductase [Acidimicrobiia bacterium]
MSSDTGTSFLHRVSEVRIFPRAPSQATKPASQQTSKPRALVTDHRPTANYELGSRTALVTGAAGSFGRAIAVRLANAGANVALADLPSANEGLKATLQVCAAANGAGRLAMVPFDVTDPDATDGAVATVSDELGIPDLICNNAGYQGAFAVTSEYPPEDIERVLNVNVAGVANVLQSAARTLRANKRGGSIVNTASMAGVSGAPNMLAYAASKGAVISLTKSAALDLAPFGIRVNAISPAFIGPGDMWDRQVQMQAEVTSPYYADDPAVVAQQMVDLVPLGRLGSVDEVAAAVVWLLSDESSYITGVNIPVSGGIIA